MSGISLPSFLPRSLWWEAGQSSFKCSLAGGEKARWEAGQAAAGAAKPRRGIRPETCHAGRVDPSTRLVRVQSSKRVKPEPPRWMMDEDGVSEPAQRISRCRLTAANRIHEPLTSWPHVYNERADRQHGLAIAARVSLRGFVSHWVALNRPCPVFEALWSRQGGADGTCRFLKACGRGTCLSVASDVTALDGAEPRRVGTVRVADQGRGSGWLPRGCHASLPSRSGGVLGNQSGPPCNWLATMAAPAGPHRAVAGRADDVRPACVPPRASFIRPATACPAGGVPTPALSLPCCVACECPRGRVRSLARPAAPRRRRGLERPCKATRPAVSNAA